MSPKINFRASCPVMAFFKNDFQLRWEGPFGLISQNGLPAEEPRRFEKSDFVVVSVAVLVDGVIENRVVVTPYGIFIAREYDEIRLIFESV